MSSRPFHIAGLSFFSKRNTFSRHERVDFSRVYTKKVVNFNILSKHRNKAQFKNLDDSKVLSRHFSDLRTSAASTASMASMTFTASFQQTKILIVMVGSSLAPLWPIQVPFWGMDHQKSNVLLILPLFLLEAVEASWCHFFEN